MELLYKQISTIPLRKNTKKLHTYLLIIIYDVPLEWKAEVKTLSDALSFIVSIIWILWEGVKNTTCRGTHTTKH